MLICLKPVGWKFRLVIHTECDINPQSALEWYPSKEWYPNGAREKERKEKCLLGNIWTHCSHMMSMSTK